MMGTSWVFLFVGTNIGKHMAVSMEIGGTPIAGWMVYFMGKPTLEMDDDWGYPHFRKAPYENI